MPLPHPTSMRAPIYVQSFMGQISGYAIGMEHVVKGIQNPIKESKLSKIEFFVIKNENSTERHRFLAEGEEFRTYRRQLKFFVEIGFTIYYASFTSVQTKAETRGKQGAHEEFIIAAYKKENRQGSSTSQMFYSNLFVIPKKTGGLKLGAPINTGMDSMPGSQNLCIPGRTHYFGGVKGGMLLQHGQGLLQARDIFASINLMKFNTVSLQNIFNL
ncbi:hypothetical protein AYI68_g7658 [Smittium mucronatum]|uniref:Uncharacterized protein n=1 Tax=Smittium mucronatum TaxID=133383 RepID=A0A1R0GN35_9FUNG|nr:hypothetical protein AYI68_g7658 [Smittium mucronatum]